MYETLNSPILPRYQRLYFRNANHPIARPSITARRQDRTTLSDPSRILEKDVERRWARESDLTFYSNQTSRNSHIFDGQTLTKETAAFQLCDITDPMLKNMIENLEGLRDVCDVCLSSYLLLLPISNINHRNAMDGTPHILLSKSKLFYDINFSLFLKGIRQVMKNVVPSLRMRVPQRYQVPSVVKS